MYTQTKIHFLFQVNRTSIRGEILKKLCASLHASTHTSQKSYFRLRQKISTGQLSCRAFQLSSEGAFLVDIPIDQFCFFKLQDMDSSSI